MVADKWSPEIHETANYGLNKLYKLALYESVLMWKTQDTQDRYKPITVKVKIHTKSFFI